MSVKRIQNYIFGTLLAVAVFAAGIPFCTLASEQPQEDKKDALPEYVSVMLPNEGFQGGSPLDFYMDPQQLIYATDAVLYGGGTVEEGATLLFHNREGDFDFSSRSDQYTLRNSGNKQISITVDAKLNQLGRIMLHDTADFVDIDGVSMYMAVIDDEGEETPLDGDNGATVTFLLDAGDSCSFGLTGACNALADWMEIDEAPVVSVTWHLEMTDVGEDEEDPVPDDLYQEILPTESTEMGAEVETDDELSAEEGALVEQDTTEATEDKTETNDAGTAGSADDSSDGAGSGEAGSGNTGEDATGAGDADAGNTGTNATGAEEEPERELYHEVLPTVPYVEDTDN